jgi:hypothetical protein
MQLNHFIATKVNYLLIRAVKYSLKTKKASI